jgi:hypothetical protein
VVKKWGRRELAFPRPLVPAVHGSGKIHGRDSKPCRQVFPAKKTVCPAGLIDSLVHSGMVARGRTGCTAECIAIGNSARGAK